MRIQKLLIYNFDITIKIIGVLFISGIILSLKFLDINFTNLIAIGIIIILATVSIILGIAFSIIYYKWLIPWGKYV